MWILSLLGFLFFGYAILVLRNTTHGQSQRLSTLEQDLIYEIAIRERLENRMALPDGIVEVTQGRMTKSTEDAACWDIYANADMFIPAGASVIVPTGIHTTMFGAHALILDRSGLAAKFRVTRRAGVIDSKYPDEWGVVLVNEGLEGYQVKAGDRIAQALFLPEYNMTVRGSGVSKSGDVRQGGFGTTGK